jgi:hypothetical protein
VKSYSTTKILLHFENPTPKQNILLHSKNPTPTPRNKLDQYQILKYLLTTESAMKKIEDNNTWNMLDQY